MGNPKTTAVDAHSLREALAQGVTEREGITAHALLDARDGKLTVTTTDTRVLVARSILARFADAWTATADFAAMKAALNGLEGEVELAAVDGRVRLSQGRRRFLLDSLDPSGFPIPPAERTSPVQVDPVALREALARVGYAATEGHEKPFFNGVLLAPDAVVGSDGYRIAIVPMTGFEHEHILPTPAIKLCTAAMESGALILAGAGEIAVETDEAQVRMRLLAAKYTDLWRGLKKPQEFAAAFRFDASAMAATIGRLQPFCTKFGTVIIEAEDGALRVLPDVSAAETVDIVEGERTRGEGEMRVAFDARYLLDVLRQAHGDAITWRHNGPFEVQVFTFGADEKPRADIHYLFPRVIS